MKQGIRRLISMVLLMGIVIGCLPIAALAANTEEITSGSVTATQVEGQKRYYNFNGEVGKWPGADNHKIIAAGRAQIGETYTSLGYSEPWCADFFSDTAHLAGISNSVIPWDRGSDSGYVPALSSWFVSMGAKQLYKAEDCQPGDVVMFSWDKKYTGPCGHYALNHVVIVTYYDKVEGKLHYVGGNQYGATALKYQADHPGVRDVPSAWRDVTETWVYKDDTRIGRIYRPNYATYDPTLPEHPVKVKLKTSGGGTATGGGTYTTGKTATVKATPKEGKQFVGWYNEKDKRVSTDAKYTFEVKDYTTLTAKFIPYYKITVKASASGTATGSGRFESGKTVTVKATPRAGQSFVGWYNVKGNRVCKTTTYKFTATTDRTVYAMFLGDKYVDVPRKAAYRQDVLDATKLGFVNGVTRLTFEPDSPLQRCMAVTMVARMDGVDITTKKYAKAPYSDVKGSAWYANAINWAYKTRVIHDISNGKYRPESNMTREEYVTLIMRYLFSKGYSIKGTNLSFKDRSKVGTVALPYMKQAQTIGLLEADENGKIDPKGKITRSDAVVMLMRAYRYMQSHGA